MVLELRIFDNAFEGVHSASLGGENRGEKPETIRWLREGPPTDPTVFTDARLGMAANMPVPGRKIAWILEPYDLHPGPYNAAIQLEEHFDLILTHDRYFANREGWKLYRYGGSWIHPSGWGMHPKTKEVSIIASEKATTEGHNLRRQIADNFPLNVFGRGYNEIESKTTALKPYRFSVVVESSRMNEYFSEKLVDCFSMGTIPIYWGCDAVDDIFDPGGIIRFQSIKELRLIFSTLSKVNYEMRGIPIMRNLEIAKHYRVCEDSVIEVLYG